MAQTAAAELDLVDIDRKRPNRFLSFGLRLMREKPLGFVGAVVIVIFFLMAVLTPVIAPDDPNALGQLSNRLQSPSLSHPFGTDNLSRDVFTRACTAIPRRSRSGSPSAAARWSSSPWASCCSSG